MSLLDAQIDVVRRTMPMRIRGRIAAVSGLAMEAAELPLPIGSTVRIKAFGGRCWEAEVMGFVDERTLLMPLTSPAGVSMGDEVVNLTSSPRIICSPGLLGRVIDGFGRPIDGLGALSAGESRRIDGRAAAPMARVNIRTPVATGVRAIDALHTCGLGQRMGIFSGPGVGKSTLMSSIARNTSADISVVALIGERGREVQEFLEHTLDAASRQRCVVIVSTGDDVPLMKVRAARVACTVCEYFRDQGLNVLLMMDSLTRLAQAQRQIGLAAREPPATKGFPPSVFALLPEILERAGRTERGSITGFYTVLVEGDDFNEPIPDAVKGITDGHLWLSRALASKGHFPAIDMLQSISRVRGEVCAPDQLAAARRVLATLASYAEIEDLVNIGAYVKGTSPDYDVAVELRGRIVDFLRQPSDEPCSFDQSRQALLELAAAIDLVTRQKHAANMPKG
ncbi:MAG TPA: FliI/YscN family ATPase [Tepidisphaeraceae bacterium]|nr:FliI/YscN family ATPase [Tepidisphaeraceae bacterium]